MRGLQKERVLIMPDFRPSTERLCYPACVIYENRTACWVLALGCLWRKIRELLSIFNLFQLEGVKGRLI